MNSFGAGERAIGLKQLNNMGKRNFCSQNLYFRVLLLKGSQEKDSTGPSVTVRPDIRREWGGHTGMSVNIMWVKCKIHEKIKPGTSGEITCL